MSCLYSVIGSPGHLGCPSQPGEKEGEDTKGGLGIQSPPPTTSYCANLVCTSWGTNVLSIRSVLCTVSAFPASYSISLIADLREIFFSFSR